ncbi:MAG: A/G-specific adenine glycosylase [Lentisphaerae bacterium]|nr:A/G-specific adenine glycosylase [Lentisphaerota bacterium]
MPWRDAPTPYAVWISEMMLQQTQVATVMPYFERFMRRFPDVHALAAADEEAVLKAWEGLGYYARARNLHRAARRVAGEWGGRMPVTATEWASLPGIGDYASAAIASIVSGEAVPAVDGNVLRVMARFRGSDDDIMRPATRRRVYEDLLPHIRDVNPSDFNQALMELGALVCRPRNPLCDACPLQPSCVAHRTGRTAELPVKTKGKAGPHHMVAMALVWRRRRLLLARRPAKGMLGGLWEFPGGRCRRGESPADAVARIILESTGLRIKVGAALAPIQHAYSHFRITAHGFTCRCTVGGQVKAGGECEALKWVRAEELADLPLTKVSRDLARGLGSCRALVSAAPHRRPPVS